jgi:hypothetical protein
MLCDMFMRCSEGGDANFRCRAQGEGIGDTTAAASLAVRGPADQREPGWCLVIECGSGGLVIGIGVCVTRVLGEAQPLFVCIPRARGRPSPSSGQTPTHVSSCGLFCYLHGVTDFAREGGVTGEKEGRRWRGFVQGRRVDEEILSYFGLGFSQPRFQVDNQR